MRLFDTHCHFESDDKAAIEPILLRAKAAGVERLMAVGGSPNLNRAAIAAVELSKSLPASSVPVCSLACGFDRSHLMQEEQEVLPDALELTAWGEIGLDYHYSPETRDSQCAHFASQLEEAKRRNLPVVIHTREAEDDTLAILKEIPSRGIIHCFTGNPDFCKALLDLGFYISLSGIVTFRVADNVRESALVVPDDRLLIETDSPYLAPVPMRGKPNEPAFVAHTLQFLAKLRNVNAEFLADLTMSNAKKVLSIL